VEDSEKVGYIPSNYVKVVANGEVPASGEGSLSASSTAVAAAVAVSATTPTPAVELEEVAIALHDLDKKDPKVLVLKRDERFLILDKNVGGGWWRCVNTATGEMALAPSNFMRTEMQPKRQPPALPAVRGSVPNQQTMFVEGTYDFTAKKSSQLSYKKHDSLVILKKDGSWWKARNKMGKEGVIPYNYVKEVFPSSFVALFPFRPRNSEEASLKQDDVVAVLDMDQPGWWLVSGPSGQGFVPSNHLHPLSTRAAGQVSAPATPRTAAGPEVPSTPRNVDGSVRVDPPASAASASGAAEQPALKVEQLSAPSVARRYSGSLSASPLAAARESAQLVSPTQTKVASVVVPPIDAFSPSATPRPEFMHEKGTSRETHSASEMLSMDFMDSHSLFLSCPLLFSPSSRCSSRSARGGGSQLPGCRECLVLCIRWQALRLLRLDPPFQQRRGRGHAGEGCTEAGVAHVILPAAVRRREQLQWFLARRDESGGGPTELRCILGAATTPTTCVRLLRGRRRGATRGR
jgi:hypothetical protein